MESVAKIYHTGRVEYPALRDVDLVIEEGELVAIGVGHQGRFGLGGPGEPEAEIGIGHQQFAGEEG